MVITMHTDATAGQIRAVADRVRELGYTPHEMPGAQRTAICVTGNRGPLDPSLFTRFDGVADAVPIPHRDVRRIAEVMGQPLG
jgi:3-deoxy-7-phosphoheptulonate synthase